MHEEPQALTTGLDGPVVLRALAPDRDADEFAAHVRRGGEPLREHLPWPDVTTTPDGARDWLTPYSEREGGRVVAVGAWRGDDLVGGGVLFNHSAADGVVELGVWVVGDAAGRGVASAICRTLIAAARRELRAERIVWICSAGNEASRRLAGRLGFRREGTLRGAFVLRGERRDLAVYGLLGGEIDAVLSTTRGPGVPKPPSTTRR